MESSDDESDPKPAVKKSDLRNLEQSRGSEKRLEPKRLSISPNYVTKNNRETEVRVQEAEKTKTLEQATERQEAASGKSPPTEQSPQETKMPKKLMLEGEKQMTAAPPGWESSTESYSTMLHKYANPLIKQSDIRKKGVNSASSWTPQRLRPSRRHTTPDKSGLKMKSFRIVLNPAVDNKAQLLTAAFKSIYTHLSETLAENHLPILDSAESSATVLLTSEKKYKTTTFTFSHNIETLTESIPEELMYSGSFQSSEK